MQALLSSSCRAFRSVRHVLFSEVRFDGKTVLNLPTHLIGLFFCNRLNKRPERCVVPTHLQLSSALLESADVWSRPLDETSHSSWVLLHKCPQWCVLADGLTLRTPISPEQHDLLSWFYPAFPFNDLPGPLIALRTILMNHVLSILSLMLKPILDPYAQLCTLSLI